MRYAILMPCYEPDERVLSLVSDLRHRTYGDIYIENDGSGPEYDPVFRSLEEMGCRVISHDKNKGKGAALRDGIRVISTVTPSYSYIITADCDGQHTPSDIRNMADHAEDAATAELANGTPAPLFVGSRDLGSSSVPLRSRFGNRFSSLYFRFVTGVKCKDTQNGLRAIPKRLFPLALETPGDRYDYEMNFLIAAAKEMRAVPVSTVYEEGNRSSHFHSVRDSVRIYKTPLRYVTVSAISAAVDLTLFTIFSAMGSRLFLSILAATALARLMSGIVNFTLNRIWSFSSIRAKEGNAAGQAARYLMLFFTQMFLSSALVYLLGFLPLPVTLIKIIVDTGLAFFSYWAQHNWVFKRDGKEVIEIETPKTQMAGTLRTRL